MGQLAFERVGKENSYVLRQKEFAHPFGVGLHFVGPDVTPFCGQVHERLDLNVPYSLQRVGRLIIKCYNARASGVG